MSEIIESIQVAVPLRTAYDQWTQFKEFPRFMEAVERVEQTSDRLTHWTVRVGGVAREFDAEIVEQVPDQRVAWRSVDGPRHAGTIDFAPLEAGLTKVTVHMDVDPDGFVETVADKLGILTWRIKGDLERFKGFVESRGYATGQWRGEIPPREDPGTGMYQQPGAPEPPQRQAGTPQPPQHGGARTTPSGTAPAPTAPDTGYNYPGTGQAPGAPEPYTPSGGQVPGQVPPAAPGQVTPPAGQVPPPRSDREDPDTGGLPA